MPESMEWSSLQHAQVLRAFVDFVDGFDLDVQLHRVYRKHKGVRGKRKETRDLKRE